MLIITLIVFFTLIDQVSKYLVVNYFHKDITIIKNTFYLIYTQNNGAAFSILTGKRLFLIIVTFLIIVAIIHYIKKKCIKDKTNIIAFSLVLGGSIGNLIDRIVRGYVVDFISVKIFNYNFPIFNIADSFICIGVFILVFISLRKEHKKW